MVQMPVSIDRTLEDSIQDQLVNEIRSLIAQNTIKSGLRLPATRALSRQLKVSRNTVKNAYAHLISQGFLESNGTSGTFVCDNIPDVSIDTCKKINVSAIENDKLYSHPGIATTQCPTEFSQSANTFDFSIRNSDPSIAPDRTWRRLLLKHLPYRSRYANNVSPAGLDLLRDAIAEYVSPLRGMSILSENSFIVSNDFRAFDIINKTMLNSESRVAVEDPCDAGIVYLLKNAGAIVIPIPVDNEGIVVDKLPMQDIDLVYVSPSHQQPTGVTLSLERRQSLLDWASKTGAHIVEWDTYGEFSYDDSPLPSIFSLDTDDRVIYLNSFQNWIGANLKLGYIVVPPGIAERILAVKEFLDPLTSWLDQRVIADFISSSSFFGHLRCVRQALKRRRDATIFAIDKNFGKQDVSGEKTGGHLVWSLPRDYPFSREVQEAASENGIVLPTLHDGFCCVDQHQKRYDPNHTIMLGYAALSEEVIADGVQRLAHTMRNSIPHSSNNTALFYYSTA